MKRGAFTLIELLVVITIIAILVAIMIPALNAMRAKTNRAKCQNNVHQIAVAAVSLFDDWHDKVPYRSLNTAYAEGAEQLLPYLKNVIEVFDCPANNGIGNPGIKTDAFLKFPNHPGYTEYELNGFLCSWGSTYRMQSGIIDMSQCAYVYDYPFNGTTEPVRAHDGGANVGYLDGHAGWLADADMFTPDNFYNRGNNF